jgi:hypothetical protein
MAYIGNTPADKFLTLAKQNFSTSATTSYTLDSAVSGTQDIALFINNVRQSPVDAYTVSGTALTLTSATAGTDEMYCVYLGKTVGTVSPASDSVTTAMLQTNAVTTDKIADGNITVAKLSTSGTEADNVKQRIAKVWCLLNGSSFGITDSFNVASATDNGTGDYTLTIDTDMGSANYSAVVDPARGAGDAILGTNIVSRAAGSLRIETCRDDSTKTDAANVSYAIFGDI